MLERGCYPILHPQSLSFVPYPGIVGNRFGLSSSEKTATPIALLRQYQH